MKPTTLLLTILLAGCSTTEKKGLFNDLADQETVRIYLSNYKLDSIPGDIGELKKVKSLIIAQTDGWTIYPPTSAIQQRVETPPFRQVSAELTTLTTLTSLRLSGLDLNQLPDNFDNLNNLDTLDVSLNKLTIANEIKKLQGLKNLKYLVLNGNKVDTTDINELKRVNPDLIIQSGLELP